MVLGLFGEQPLEAFASFQDLRWVVFRDVAEMSETTDAIASKLDRIVEELEGVLSANGYRIYDTEPRQRGRSIDFLVLAVPAEMPQTS